MANIVNGQASAYDTLDQLKSVHAKILAEMKKELADSYCSFIFDILFELEKQTNPSQYNKYQARLYGYISELLLDVWIMQNNLKYKEVPFINMEKTKWLKKGSSFLKAKFLGKKYD